MKPRRLQAACPALTRSSWIREKIGEAKAKGIADLAGLESDVRQGDPFDAVPIYITVACGRPSLSIEDTDFKLATWQVLVRIDLENARIKFGSILSIMAQEGSFESQSSTKTTLLTIREHAAVLEFGATGKASHDSVSLSGSMRAGLNRKQSEKTSDTATGTTKTVAEIVVIGPFGSSVIAIGDPDYGDPHKEYGLLGHRYPKERGDDIKPLFAVEPEDPDKPVKVTIMTTIPFDKLCLQPMQRNKALEELARDEITERSNEAIEEYEILRRQMLRGELASRMSQNQKKSGLAINDNEFAVMVDVFEIRPK
jgi:hypothetical protein